MTVENAVKNNGGKNMSYNEFYHATLLATIATKKYLMLPDVMENRCCYRWKDRYGKG